MEQILGEGFFCKYSLAAFKDSAVPFAVVLLNETVYGNSTLVSMTIKSLYKDQRYVVIPFVIS